MSAFAAVRAFDALPDAFVGGLAAGDKFGQVKFNGLSALVALAFGDHGNWVFTCNFSYVSVLIKLFTVLTWTAVVHADGKG